jgi:hypothetical protein
MVLSFAEGLIAPFGRASELSGAGRERIQCGWDRRRISADPFGVVEPPQALLDP